MYYIFMFFNFISQRSKITFYYDYNYLRLNIFMIKSPFAFLLKSNRSQRFQNDITGS
jgi:hypothetical protein